MLYSIGHSNLALSEFLALLRRYEVDLVVDVRSYPGSRKHPQFGREPLQASLRDAGIEYLWAKDLGGRRKKMAGDSPNAGLTSPGFRNYADYMMTEEFAAALDRLVETARDRNAAILCAEKLYWKCHRRLICDALLARGIVVRHILELDRASDHTLTRGAVITDEGGVQYPGEEGESTPEQGLLF